MDMKFPSRTFREAVNYFNQGFSVIPIKEKSKEPSIPWKKYQQERAGTEELNKWFNNGNQYNIGIVLGKISKGLICLDFDGENWFDGWIKFINKFKDLLGKNPFKVVTGSGKRHIWLKYRDLPEKVTIPNKKFDHSTIEFRANGQYVLAPPSIHPSGERYSFSFGHREIVEINKEQYEELVDWFKGGKSISSARKLIPYTGNNKISEGERNNTLFSLASTLRRENVTPEGIKNLLTEENEKRCDPPLEDKEIDSIVQSVLKYPTGEEIDNEIWDVFEDIPITVETQKVFQYRHMSDVGNAECFQHLFSKDWRYILEKEKWLKFNGVIWKENKNGARRAMVKTMRVRQYIAKNTEPKDNKEEEILKTLKKFSNSSENKNKIENSLRMAALYMDESITSFDKNPYLLACKNGVIDLKTGKLREAKTEDFLLNSIDIKYDKNAKCPRWKQFLREIFKGDEELIEYIQRAIGYTLTGNIDEQVFFILYGKGANGKSTFLNIMKKLLGSFYRNASAKTFKSTPYDSIPEDLARLAGARLVTCSEMKQGSYLNGERIKSLTGEDTITARFLHENSFEYDPNFKIWLGVNHKPKVGTDYAMWRRIILIPFEAKFDKEKADLKLSDKLMEELPGILNWAIEGCLNWQKRSLKDNPPKKILDATNEYEKENNILQYFIDECLEVVKEEETKAMDIFDTYVKWCAKSGYNHMGKINFYKGLVDMGYEKRNAEKNINYFKDLIIKNDVNEYTEDRKII